MNPFLQEALRLAQERKGFTSPNPAVGAVVVKDGKVVGKGTHWAAGQAHAEVNAIEQAEDVAGATLFVTLEPCCHFGRTPPCTDLIIRKKISKVVYGYRDPNPLVAGQGSCLLQEAGIQVLFENSPQVEKFYRSYRHWTINGKPWLTGKLALTRDLKTSKLKNARHKITGEQADRHTHFRRKQADVLLTSFKTVNADDPLFNVRLSGEEISKPVWILDRKLEFSLNSKIKRSSQKLTLVYSPPVAKERLAELASHQIETLSIPASNQKINLSPVVQELGKKGFHEAWVELGPQLFLAFLEAQLFNEVVLYFSTQTLERGEGPGDDLYRALAAYERVSENTLGLDRQEVWFLKP